MHGSEGKASKRRRFAQQLAKMNEKSERVASFGLREATKRDDSSGEDEDLNSQKNKAEVCTPGVEEHLRINAAIL